VNTCEWQILKATVKALEASDQRHHKCGNVLVRRGKTHQSKQWPIGVSVQSLQLIIKGSGNPSHQPDCVVDCSVESLGLPSVLPFARKCWHIRRRDHQIGTPNNP